MRKIITTIVALVMLTALPLGVLGQEVVSSDAVVVSQMDPYFWWPEPSVFNYSEGFANGTYVDFHVDESTGTVTDYTVTKLQIYDFIYPLLIYEEARFVGEDGDIFTEEFFPEYNTTSQTSKIFESIVVQNFVPNGHPAVFGEQLFFLGENVMMNFWDYDWASGSYVNGEENTTITLTVAEPFEILTYYDYFDLNYDDWEVWEDDYEYETNEWYVDEFGKEDPMPPISDENWTDTDLGGIYLDDSVLVDEHLWIWDEIWLECNNTMTSIWIENGQATIDAENNTITIELYDGGRMDFNTWHEMPYIDCCLEPWYDDQEFIEEKGLIETMLEDGFIAAAGYLFVDEEGTEWSDANYFNDPTFGMQFMDIEEDWFEVEVESRVPEGRIVSINVNNGALDAKEMNDLLVMLDDLEIHAYDSLEELKALEGGTEAGYYAIFGDTQSTVYVYVPHFSTHTIRVQSILGGVTNLIVPGLLAVVFIAVAAIAVIARGKKGGDL